MAIESHGSGKATIVNGDSCTVRIRKKERAIEYVDKMAKVPVLDLGEIDTDEFGPRAAVGISWRTLSSRQVTPSPIGKGQPAGGL